MNSITNAAIVIVAMFVEEGQAMTKKHDKQIPRWLTIDVAVILVSLVIIGIGVLIAP